MKRQINAFNDRLVRVTAYFSNNWHLIAVAVAFICFQALILPSLLDQILSISGGVMILDLSLWYTPEEVDRRLADFGEEGRNLYLIAEWTADLAYPAIYALFIGALTYRLGGNRWSTLPLYSGMADWAENVAVTLLLLQYPDFNPAIAVLSATFTALKWIFLGGSGIVLAALLFCKLENMARA